MLIPSNHKRHTKKTTQLKPRQPPAKQQFYLRHPCNLRETASLAISYTDPFKRLIYKEKRRFSAPLS